MQFYKKKITIKSFRKNILDILAVFKNNKIYILFVGLRDYRIKR